MDNPAQNRKKQSITCILKMSDSLSSRSHGYLCFLYEPIIKQRACMLYESLYALALLKEEYDLEDILEFCSLSKNQFNQSRKELERLLLAATYASEDHSELLIYLIPPKTPRAFLRHEILGRLFLNETSSAYLQKIKNLYALDFSPAGFENISEKLQSDRLETRWTAEKEAVIQKQKPKVLDFSYPFNWKVFFKGASRVFPERLRTEKNKNRIAMLANIYGIDETQMRRFVSRYIDEPKTSINFEQLENDLKFTIRQSPDLNKIKDPWQLPPVSFYVSLQANGSEALPEEKEVIAKVCEQFSFSNEVMNTLLDYCLENCDKKFIEKIIVREANAWARNGITTRNQALEFIENQGLFKNSASRKNEKPMVADGSTLPDWYKEVPTEKADDDLIARFRQMQESLKNLK